MSSQIFNVIFTVNYRMDELNILRKEYSSSLYLFYNYLTSYPMIGTLRY